MIQKFTLNIKQVFGLALDMQKRKKFDEAKKLYQKVLENNPKIIEAQYNLGVVYEQFNQNENAIQCYRKAINLNPSFIYSYNNLGLIFHKLGQYSKSIEYFDKILEINPNYVNAYNNLGIINVDQGKYKEAIEYFLKALKIENKNQNALNNLIFALNFYTPNNKNSIIILNNELKKLNKSFNIKKKLMDNKYLSIFLKNALHLKNKDKDLVNSNFIETQIYRKNLINLNCERHHNIFNKKNIVPNFCFSCFKIQIEPSNIINLIKLYLIFDNFKFKKNNLRKCLIELRPEITGTYKGIIYCSSAEEAEEILKDISPTLVKTIKYKSSIRRGCSEFYKSFPNFKIIKRDDVGFMEYDKKWDKIEQQEDLNKPHKKITLSNSLSGLSISDVMIIDKWLYYANIIGDKSFEKLGLNFNRSEYIDYKIKNQKEFRKKQFLS